MFEFFNKNGKFYILPSSIHEIIFVPKNLGIEVEDLQNMVKEVNEKEVSEEEWLSDNVYLFDGELKIA